MVRFSYLEFVLIMTNLGTVFTLYDQNDKLKAQMDFIKTQNNQIKDLQNTLSELQVDIAKMHEISNSSNSMTETGRGTVQNILDFTANNSKALLIILIIITLMYITYGVYTKIFYFSNLIPSFKLPSALSALFTKDSEQTFWSGDFKFKVLIDQDKVSSITVRHQDEVSMRPIEEVLAESYLKIDELTRSLSTTLNSSIRVNIPENTSLSLVSQTTGEKVASTVPLDNVQDLATQIISNCGVPF